jgi:hypothetical protein
VFNGLLAEGYAPKNIETLKEILSIHHQDVFGKPLKETPLTGATDARFF